MSWPHIHITINHFPVIGIWIAWVILTVGVIKNHGTVKKVGLKLLTGLAVITPVVFWTGELAEHRLPEVTHAPNPAGIIEHHEAFALVSMVGLLVLGALGVAGVVLINQSRKPGRQQIIPRWFFPLVILFNLIVAVQLGFTANLGGQIRHTEIRGDTYSRWIMGLPGHEVHGHSHPPGS